MAKALAWLSKPKTNTFDTLNWMLLVILTAHGHPFWWVLGGFLPLEILSIRMERKYHGTQNSVPMEGRK